MNHDINEGESVQTVFSLINIHMEIKRLLYRCIVYLAYSVFPDVTTGLLYRNKGMCLRKIQ